MKHKKLLLLIPVPFIIAAFVVFIQPKETVFDETIRFYNVEHVNYGGGDMVQLENAGGS